MKKFKPVYSEKIEGFGNRKKIFLERWINIGSQIREKGLNLCKKLRLLRPHWNKSTCAIHDKNTLKYSDPLSSGSPSFSTLPLLLVFPTSCKQQIAAKLKQQQALQFAISVFFCSSRWNLALTHRFLNVRWFCWCFSSSVCVNCVSGFNR